MTDDIKVMFKADTLSNEIVAAAFEIKCDQLHQWAHRVAALEHALQDRDLKISTYVQQLDNLYGTPCEQIRHQQQVDKLNEEIAALKDIIGNPPVCNRCNYIERVECRARLEAAEAKVSEPIPMVLFCPNCHEQHIDEPDYKLGWTNPPHKSHLCHKCGTVWRPTDKVCTVGVAFIDTLGASDTWTP